MGEGRPPRRPHTVVLGRDDLRVVRASSAHRHLIVASPLAEALHFNGEGRPPRRPHFHVASGFIPRSILAIHPGIKPVTTSAQRGRDDLRVVRIST